MSYTLSEAAKATGKNKATIQRAIKSGRISAKKQSNGNYAIDPSELHRVFDATSQRVAQHTNATKRNDQKSEDFNALQRIAELEKELAVMEAMKNGVDEQKQQLSETVDDLRKRLDQSENRITALIGQSPRRRRFLGLF